MSDMDSNGMTVEQKVENELRREIRRCERLIRKYADGGAGHTAAFADIKSGIAMAKKALAEGTVLSKTGVWLDIRELS